jgi:predicted hotdog family 3-hydroxylacyl-ACP dehydratase
VSERCRPPYDVLPHGPGLHFLGERRESSDGELAYAVLLSNNLCVVGAAGTIEPEVGLEIMAQACGMLMSADNVQREKSAGVVAAVRGYEYSATPLFVGQRLIVTARPVMVDGELAVCEGELADEEGRALQMARITLVCRQENA